MEAQQHLNANSLYDPVKNRQKGGFQAIPGQELHRIVFQLHPEHTVHGPPKVASIHPEFEPWAISDHAVGQQLRAWPAFSDSEEAKHPIYAMETFPAKTAKTDTRTANMRDQGQRGVQAGVAHFQERHICRGVWAPAEVRLTA